MDVSQYVQGWKERARHEEEALDQEKRRARELAPQLARVLAERFGARRVALVGSLARGTYGPRSDIDLLAEGLSPRQIEEANLELNGTQGFAVDVIRAEDVSPRWQPDLERHQEILWPIPF